MGAFQYMVRSGKWLRHGLILVHPVDNNPIEVPRKYGDHWGLSGATIVYTTWGGWWGWWW
jgi:hypothetical protein